MGAPTQKAGLASQNGRVKIGKIHFNSLFLADSARY